MNEQQRRINQASVRLLLEEYRRTLRRALQQGDLEFCRYIDYHMSYWAQYINGQRFAIVYDTDNRRHA